MIRIQVVVFSIFLIININIQRNSPIQSMSTLKNLLFVLGLLKWKKSILRKGKEIKKCHFLSDEREDFI